MKIAVYLWVCFFSESLWASEYATQVHNVKVELVADSYELNADLNFQLSPVAKEALHRGIALTWTLLVKIEEKGEVWNHTVQSLGMDYQIQNHALLNLYSLKRLSTGERSVFSTLAGALNSLSKIRRMPVLDKLLVRLDKQYSIAVKVKFKRESLPIPLRPFSYFDAQWALSSQWTLWPFQQ